MREIDCHDRRPGAKRHVPGVPTDPGATNIPALHGCVANPSETMPPAEAEQASADYIAQKYRAERRRQDMEDVDCADVLPIYWTGIGGPSDQFKIEARIEVKEFNRNGGLLTRSPLNGVDHIRYTLPDLPPRRRACPPSPLKRQFEKISRAGPAGCSGDTRQSIEAA